MLSIKDLKKSHKVNNYLLMTVRTYELFCFDVYFIKIHYILYTGYIKFHVNCCIAVKTQRTYASNNKTLIGFDFVNKNILINYQPKNKIA